MRSVSFTRSVCNPRIVRFSSANRAATASVWAVSGMADRSTLDSFQVIGRRHGNGIFPDDDARALRRSTSANPTSPCRLCLPNPAIVDPRSGMHRARPKK